MRVRDENDRKVSLSEMEDKINNCELLSFNGRGIMIIKNYMDHFEFRCLAGRQRSGHGKKAAMNLLCFDTIVARRFHRRAADEEFCWSTIFPRGTTCRPC